MYVYDTLTEVNQALQRCDEILEEAALGIGYVSRQSDIDRLLEGRVTLRIYIDALNYYVDDKLDQPLRQDFKKNATETIKEKYGEDNVEWVISEADKIKIDSWNPKFTPHLMKNI